MGQARAAGVLVVGLGGAVERPSAGPFVAVLPVHSRPRQLDDALNPELTARDLSATTTELVRLVLAAQRSAQERT